MRILLTESGHYIIPINQQSNYDISEEDKAKTRQMLQGSSKPYHARDFTRADWKQYPGL